MCESVSVSVKERERCVYMGIYVHVHVGAHMRARACVCVCLCLHVCVRGGGKQRKKSRAIVDTAPIWGGVGPIRQEKDVVRTDRGVEMFVDDNGAGLPLLWL